VLRTVGVVGVPVVVELELPQAVAPSSRITAPASDRLILAFISISLSKSGSTRWTASIAAHRGRHG